MGADGEWFGVGGADRVDLVDRFVGCVLGGAIGDVLGGPYEGGGAAVGSHPIGHPSDDTQLTLAACEAIADGGEVTPAAVARRMLVWYRERRLTGLGASTLGALRALEAGAHWSMSGTAGEYAAGNGAAMRVAPLAFCLDPNDTEDRACLRDVCRITHKHEEAYVGALAIVVAVRAMVGGTWQPGGSLCALVANALPDSLLRDRLRSLVELPPVASIAEALAHTGTSGWVVESVPAALFAAQQVEFLGLQVTLERAIACGGDTDTIASMAGQVAGARLGARRLPAAVTALVPDPESVIATARASADRIVES